MNNIDGNIIENVYDTLSTHTEKIGSAIAERDSLEEKIKAGRYSPQALRDEIYPQRDELNRKIENMTAAAFKEAESQIAQFRQDVAESNRLDPADLTDDVKLLQPGIILTPEDIQGMIKRNEDNRTMLQVILRYAQQNNIDTGNLLYVGGQQEEETAQNLEGILYYYKKWINEPKALEMLDQFFIGTGILAK